MRRTLSVVITAVLASVACTQPAPPTQPTPRTPGVQIPLVRLGSDARAYEWISGYQEPTTLVVRDGNTWRATWNQVYASQNPVPPLPAIDFSAEMIVVAALGIVPAGPDIILTGASATNGGVTVDVAITSAGSNCVTPAVQTSPVDLARMPRRDGEVLFAASRAVRQCL